MSQFKAMEDAVSAFLPGWTVKVTTSPGHIAIEASAGNASYGVSCVPEALNLTAIVTNLSRQMVEDLAKRCALEQSAIIRV